MKMKFYDVVIRGSGLDRSLRVPSPTDAQAIDAAAPALEAGESVLSVTEVEDDGLQAADALPPISQAEALASSTPGAAAVDTERSQ